ncbi:MAG: SpoIIE family protein phosphatase, partial [Candidatus Sericytochromatia bacterium]|nr:SpoIIE family protein phosphatase [Candidatus Tanganyikabacteria bacterium]
AGPAGAGKDRLLAELRALRQASGGVRFAAGRCSPAGGAYQPFDEAVRALTDERPPWRAEREGATSRSALFGACAAFFARLARGGPLAVHLADWHHADPASRALLEHLLKAAPPGRVAFLVSQREPAGAYVLPPLDAPSAGALAAAMLGGARLAPDLAAELHRLSEGNPLYLEGILARTLDLGLLAPSDEGWRPSRPLAAHALPFNLAEALRERLSGQSPEAAHLARTLAVVGHAADPAWLAPASDLAPDSFGRALDDLEAVGLVWLRDGRVEFAQSALAEAISQGLPEADRVAIGRRIVLALEDALSPEGREQDPVAAEDLARHSWAWDPAGRGLRYGLAAARQHLRIYAVDRAREFLGTGLAYLEGEAADPAVARLEPAFCELAADADRHSGSFEAARARYAALLDRLAEDDPRRPRALASLGLACQSLSAYEQALGAFEQAVAAARAQGDVTQELRALTSGARLAYLDGDTARAGRSARAAVARAREAGSDTYLAEALALLGYLMAMADPAAAPMGLEILAESLSIRRGAGDLVAVADSLMFMGNAQLAAGRPLDALRRFSENLQICRDTGAGAEDAITALLNIALARLDLGAFHEGAGGAREAQAAASEAGNRDLIVYAKVIEAVAGAQTGDLARAWRLLDEALAVARELESPYLEAAALAIGGEAHLAAGAALRARDDLARARTLAADVGTGEFTARILAQQAEAHLLLAEYGAAREALADLETLAAALGPCSGGARWRLLRGELARRLGDCAEAEGWFGQALDLAEQLGMMHVAAQAALGRGRARADCGRHDAAREDLLFAQRTAARSACPHLLIDSLLALARTTFDPAEARRYQEMAEGHLAPLLSRLGAEERARYLALGERRTSHGAPGARVPPELEALLPLLDRPLRDLLAGVAGTGPAALPVDELLGRLLAAEPDPDLVLARTLEVARVRFGAERCLAVVKDGGELGVRAMHPDSEDLLRFSRSFIDMALAQDRTMWTVDALADPRLSATASVASLEMRAIACTPVRADGRPVGALYLDWSDPSGGLSDAGRREFETLAGMAGVCLAQAELRSSLAQRSERLEMAGELSAALAHALEFDTLLELALRHCMRISGAQSGCVLVGPDLAPRIARDAGGNPVEGMHVSNGARDRLLREQAAFALIDAEAESLSASVAAAGLRSVMAVPVHVGGQLRGAFYLASEVSVRGFGPRDLALLEAVANQVAVALGRVDLVEALARRERMERELQIARDVQQALLPKRMPAGPGFALAASSLPALEVGGDFHDVVRLPDGRVGLLIGDVAGKGVPAALLMATLLSGFRAIAPSEPAPDRVLGRLNDLLIAHRASHGVFATALYAIFDPASRTLELACAGHTPPLAMPVPVSCEGPVLGLLPGMAFEARAVPLEPGAVLVFYTDGLEDARGPERGVIAPSDLAARFAELCRAPAADIASGLLALAMGEDAGSAAPYDDVTILVLSVEG